jgi:hypothetical protein
MCWQFVLLRAHRAELFLPPRQVETFFLAQRSLLEQRHFKSLNIFGEFYLWVYVVYNHIGAPGGLFSNTTCANREKPTPGLPQRLVVRKTIFSSNANDNSLSIRTNEGFQSVPSVTISPRIVENTRFNER